MVGRPLGTKAHQRRAGNCVVHHLNTPYALTDRQAQELNMLQIMLKTLMTATMPDSRRLELYWSRSLWKWILSLLSARHLCGKTVSLKMSFLVSKTSSPPAIPQAPWQGTGRGGGWLWALSVQTHTCVRTRGKSPKEIEYVLSTEVKRASFCVWSVKNSLTTPIVTPHNIIL